MNFGQKRKREQLISGAVSSLLFASKEKGAQVFLRSSYCYKYRNNLTCFVKYFTVRHTSYQKMFPQFSAPPTRGVEELLP
jgi:hypothetical protein